MTLVDFPHRLLEGDVVAFSGHSPKLTSGNEESGFRLEDYIRTVPDFPKTGIQYKDITPLLRDAAAFRYAIQAMVAPLRRLDVDVMVGVEARGYLFGAPIALELGISLVPVRKLGKLPWRTYSAEYSLEYGTATLEIHQDGVKAGARAVIVDDVLATGGTLEATAKLIEQSDATVVAMAVLIELAELEGRERLEGYNLESLMVV